MMAEPTPEILASRVQMKDKTLITDTGGFRDRKRLGLLEYLFGGG